MHRSTQSSTYHPITSLHRTIYRLGRSETN